MKYSKDSIIGTLLTLVGTLIGFFLGVPLEVTFLVSLILVNLGMIWGTESVQRSLVSLGREKLFDAKKIRGIASVIACIGSFVLSIPVILFPGWIAVTIMLLVSVHAGATKNPK